VHAYLMYGFPTQTVQDTVDALEYVRQLFAAGCIQSGFFHRFACTVHSPVGQDPQAYGVTLQPLPDPGPTLAPEARRELAATGLGNPVTAVLIAYRSFDTMLEKIVLLLAVVGVWSLAPDRFWGGAPPPLGRANPQGALLLLAKILVPLGIIVGVHMFWIGADAPGGAFQAGAILAAMWMIAMIARVTEPPCVNSRWLRLALIAGPAVFLVVGLAGLGLAGNFFAYPDGFAKPIILVIEAFMLLSITVTLPILVAGPPRRGPKPRRGHKP
jgi:multisubunit Na+/H+ antiporter MnhB subunit